MADRYLGNKKKLEYHDLYNQKAACQIAEIREPVPFSSEAAAEAAGYDRCAHCLGGSKR